MDNSQNKSGSNAPNQGDRKTAGSFIGGHQADFERHLKSTGRYTRFVSVMKFTLPTLAIILVGIAFLIPAMDKEPDTISLEYLSISESDQKLTMTKPRFLSSDKGNQQFMVTAESATQESISSRKIELTQMQADITLKNGHWLSVTAPKGWLDPDTETLDLVGGVEIFSDDGNQFSAKSARVKLKERRFMSPDGLTGHGPLGEISADSFVANQVAGTLRFEGNVKMTLYP
ncbi:LPS export ABC transporter periplasmic protein LptC [Alphaproteobacteria bacterium 46_93_T64]|nr:LPS export ABC transporter periplasmic protein LptC [Alphaproteobacteria bacterium 46_93_T64]